MVWNYRDLKIWQKSRAMIPVIYELTKKFPKHELYGLTSQLQRAIRSVSENIVEGSGKSTIKNFISYLYNSVGSAREVQDELMSARDLKYVNENEIKKIIAEIMRIERMILGYIDYLKKKEKEDKDKKI